MEKIDFKYDVLYVYDDRYEFKKKAKKPLLEILSDIFIVKESWAFVFIPVFALMLFLVDILKIGYLLSILFPMIAFLFLRYYYHYKDVVIQKEQIQSIQVRKNKLIIYYHNNKTKGLVTKIVNLLDDEKNIIDKLGVEVFLVDSN